ncbi:MAG: SEL1-like repeat protein, partial [Alphaproteobacteria bacterium]|nr:SEL1-like repeat protein [Alphaproteobacteria bacterium]
YRARLNDAKAIEILAWMYTNGVGVAQDLPKAFYLYRQAEKLKVDNAGKNAIAVYKAMPPEQRAKVTAN